MSGATVLKLTRVAQAEQVQGLCAELAEAVAARDIARIYGLDHALRSRIMAMLGEGAPRDAQDIAVLTGALDSLKGSVAALRMAQRRGRGVRALYLAPRG